MFAATVCYFEHVQSDLLLAPPVIVVTRCWGIWWRRKRNCRFIPVLHSIVFQTWMLGSWWRCLEQPSIPSAERMLSNSWRRWEARPRFLSWQISMSLFFVMINCFFVVLVAVWSWSVLNVRIRDLMYLYLIGMIVLSSNDWPPLLEPTYPMHDAC